MQLLKAEAQAPQPQLHWLRNKYLHRSARAVTEVPAYIGMESADDDTRVIIRDDESVGKFSTPTKEYLLDKAEAVKKGAVATKDYVRDKAEATSQGLAAAKKKLQDLWNSW